MADRPRAGVGVRGDVPPASSSAQTLLLGGPNGLSTTNPVAVVVGD
jgi:hypothetical protein